ncbi:MAG: hypothetical protein IKZ87_04250 [Actinomycetaceae bacterium]|nr:hypothetical protein [Actinomycetaceae bacterium]
MSFIVLFLIGAALGLGTAASFFGAIKLGKLSFAFAVVVFEVLVTTWLVGLLGYEMQLAQCVVITCGFVPFCFGYFFHKSNLVLTSSPP